MNLPPSGGGGWGSAGVEVGKGRFGGCEDPLPKAPLTSFLSQELC